MYAENVCAAERLPDCLNAPLVLRVKTRSLTDAAVTFGPAVVGMVSFHPLK